MGNSADAPNASLGDVKSPPTTQVAEAPFGSQYTEAGHGQEGKMSEVVMVRVKMENGPADASTAPLNDETCLDASGTTIPQLFPGENKPEIYATPKSGLTLLGITTNACGLKVLYYPSLPDDATNCQTYLDISARYRDASNIGYKTDTVRVECPKTLQTEVTLTLRQTTFLISTEQPPTDEQPSTLYHTIDGIRWEHNLPLAPGLIRSNP